MRAFSARASRRKSGEAGEPDAAKVVLPLPPLRMRQPGVPRDASSCGEHRDPTNHHNGNSSDDHARRHVAGPCGRYRGSQHHKCPERACASSSQEGEPP